ncbi:MAG: hypothetical protein Kow0089_22930 [Desulfobulbaceae bacterium]
MNRSSALLSAAIGACLLVLFFPLSTLFWIYPHFTGIITFEKEVNAKQIATHISKMLRLDSSTRTLEQQDITDDFIRVLEEARSDFDLAKVKIFSAGGDVLYSSDPREIGEHNTHAYFTDVVARGKIYSTVVRKNEKTLEGQQAGKDVVETYIPLMHNGSFIGAFEIYYDITYGEYNRRDFVAKSLIMVLAVSFLLILCILFLSVTAVRLRKKLHGAEREIERLRERIPALYSLPEDDE